MASPVRDTAWLEWMARLMGAASRQKHTAKLPPQQFHCLLDELPLHLIPTRARDSQHARDILSQPLFLNPHCSVLPAGEIPPALESRRDLLEGLYLGCAVAWVRDPATGAWQPFWLGPRLKAIVGQLQGGEPVPASLPDDSRLQLAVAGVLTPADHAERRCAGFHDTAQERAQTFREKNYVPIADLIHPFHLAALRRYYRYQIRRGMIHLGDEQSSRRYVAHNEPVARFFHYQIARAVSALVGEPVKPSYVYLASYLSGAELKKHIDREQCEFSVTLCLDFSPEPDLATPWPICLDTPQGTIRLYQALGDGLVYRGTKVPHFRSVLGEGYSSTSIFFHYVAEDFSGTLD